MRNKNAKVSDPNSFVTCAGDKEHIIYSPEVQKDGTILLKESGRENIQDKIQSFASQTDMAWILKQLSIGNTSVLTSKTAMFGDFTEMPKTMPEVLQLYIDGQRAFEELSSDMKAKFDNNFMKWFASAGAPDWYEKMGISLVKDEAPSDSADLGEQKD